MRTFIALVLLAFMALGIALALSAVPFGVARPNVGNYCLNRGIAETGAVNIVTSVVLSYRGYDTLGEVTILFVAALGLGAVLSTIKRKSKGQIMPASLVLTTACKFLFPFILLFGTYIFLHGHLTPGGGFQGGAIIASGFLLTYLGCPGRRVNENRFKVIESLGGLVFVVVGLLGLALGGSFLFNFLPKGTPNELISSGVLPIIYVGIGLKVGTEIAGIIDYLIEES